MSKIVKYCNSCEEGFAAKFGFCPNCGNQLQAFEMNPLNNEPSPAKPVEAKPASESVAPSAPVNKTTGSLPVGDLSSGAPVEKIAAVETPAVIPAAYEPKPPVEVKPAAPEITAPSVIETPAVTMPAVVAQPPAAIVPEPVKAVKPNSEPVNIDGFKASKVNPPAKNAYQTFVDGAGSPPKAPKSEYVADSGYYITVIEEKNGSQRNKLLLASLVLICVVLAGSWTYSLFAKDLMVGAIDQADLIASISDVVPVPIDEVPPPKKDKDDGGGGGGGGRNQDEDASKGRLPPQVKDPITPPSPTIPRLTNPELKLSQATKGDNPRPVTDENTGVPTGLAYNRSSGRGSGNGIGNGFGNGVGNGRGDGEGNGIGSGSGNGNGTGSGNGNGPGTGGPQPPPPPAPKPSGPSKGLAITSKPRANYTDSARQASIQGTVTLRVTFNANGTIGGISPVSGLPNGLTEQAIAAARSIRFDPAMVNGVPTTVTKQVQYTFTIY